MDARLAKKKRIQWKEGLRCRRFWAKATREYGPSLMKYARRLSNGDESKAEDLVQEVFARIFRYLPEPESIRSSPQHYLFRILRNCWTMTKPRVEEISLDEVVEPAVQFPTISHELGKVMEIVLEKMGPDFPDLETILAMWLCGYSFREIDEYLRRGPGYSRTIWRRFINELRKLLTPTSEDKQKPAA